MNETPSEDAYGRVTNPARFASLHDAADRIVEELTDRFEVEVLDVEVDWWMSSTWNASHAIRLTPTGGGASATVVWTSFPGVGLVVGHASRFTFPACGCDACDEDPGDEAERLRRTIGAVTSGGFSETRKRRHVGRDVYRTDLRHNDGSEQWGLGEIDEYAGARVPQGTTTWPRWIRRGVASRA